MTPAAFGRESFKFMSELLHNNNKNWFDANRARYEEHVREPLKALAAALETPARDLIPGFTGPAKIARINNDIRFSPGKPPYKTHLWVEFPAGPNCLAGIMFYLDGEGWGAGCCVQGAKTADLHPWRRRLIERASEWRRLWKTAANNAPLVKHIPDSFKKPIFDDIPADLLDLVQARSVWIVQSPRRELPRSPEAAALSALKEMLPLYRFMAG